jgi:hypothetical protein
MTDEEERLYCRRLVAGIISNRDDCANVLMSTVDELWTMLEAERAEARNERSAELAECKVKLAAQQAELDRLRASQEEIRERSLGGFWLQTLVVTSREECEQLKAKLARVAAICERDDDLSGEEILGEISEICHAALKGTP